MQRYYLAHYVVSSAGLFQKYLVLHTARHDDERLAHSLCAFAGFLFGDRSFDHHPEFQLVAGDDLGTGHQVGVAADVAFHQVPPSFSK
jgi:hypothetical protein